MSILKKLALITFLLFFASACSTKVISNDIGFISTDVQTECALAVELPERNLSNTEVERYWMQDRIELAICREKHKEIVRTVLERTKK